MYVRVYVRPCVYVLSCVRACVRSWASPLVSLQPPRLSPAHNFAELRQSKTNRLVGYSAGSKRDYLYYFCHRDSSPDTQTDTMREILHLQTGQCGNQIGSKVRTSIDSLFLRKKERKKKSVSWGENKTRDHVTIVWILCYAGWVTIFLSIIFILILLLLFSFLEYVDGDFIEIGSKALC